MISQLITKTEEGSQFKYLSLSSHFADALFHTSSPYILVDGKPRSVDVLQVLLCGGTQAIIEFKYKELGDD